VGNADI